MAKSEIVKPGRAMWKGYLKLALVSCPIALYKATTTAERITFNGINRETGNRLKQQMVDAVTEAVVPSEQRIKGYEVGKNQYVLIEEAELEKIKPQGDKVIDLEQFVKPDEIDAAYHDERYYLIPDDPVGEETFAVIRGALAKKGVVGMGKIVMRSRQRPLILSPLGNGLMATTLHYTAEVRSPVTAFGGLRDIPLSKELLEIATLLIDRKMTRFNPETFVDQYEQGMIELIKAKQAGKTFVSAKADPEPGKVVNLMEAFKASLAETAAMPRVKPAAGGKGRQTATVTKLPTAAAKKTAAAAKRKGR